MLSESSAADWTELSEQVHHKSIVAEKLAHCLDNECNEYELSILISLLSTDDQEL